DRGDVVPAFPLDGSLNALLAFLRQYLSRIQGGAVLCHDNQVFTRRDILEEDAPGQAEADEDGDNQDSPEDSQPPPVSVGRQGIFEISIGRFMYMRHECFPFCKGGTSSPSQPLVDYFFTEPLLIGGMIC